jgi:hypothetical protein
MFMKTAGSWLISSLYLIVSILVTSTHVLSQPSFSGTSVNKGLPLKFNWENLYDKTLANQFPMRLTNGYHDVNGIPYLHTGSIQIPSGTEVTSVTLLDVIYEVLQVNDIPKEQVFINNRSESEWIADWSVGSVKGSKVLNATIRPWKFENGSLYVLKSCRLVYNTAKESPQRQLQRSFANQSVLADGNWFKITVRNDGVYRIDRNFVRSMGVNPDTIDPAKLHVFGNGFGLLPESNSVYRPDDLNQLAVEVVGGGDGSFDQSDYILFYAKGPVGWRWNNGRFVHQQHYYDVESTYFLNYDLGRSSKLIPNMAMPDVPHNQSVNIFNDYGVIEDDVFNLVKSGNQWFGDRYDVKTSYNYTFNFPNITGSAEITARVLGNGGNQPSSYTISVNGTPSTANIGISATGVGAYAPRAAISLFNHVYTPSGSPVQITLNYNKPSPSSEGWLDYLVMNVTRNLVMSGNQMAFRNVAVVGSGNIARYSLLNAGAVTSVWEITSHYDLKRLDLNYGSGNQLEWVAGADSLREFIAVAGVNFPAPRFIGAVQNQNLHGAGQQDLVIIVPPALKGEADRLAQHRSNQGLRVLVVTPLEVYNEFSSGMADATAYRDLMRMFYKRAGGDPNEMPKNLLLFGDGSYDNRGLKFSVNNLLLTYQSHQSVSVTSSYTTDDYFGLLDDNEGMGSNDLMDIGVGRLPVKTVLEAREAVDKIIRYEQNSAPDLSFDCCSQGNATMGDWRNMLTFIADDEDYNAYVNGAEEFSKFLDTNHREYAIEKIYLDAFQQLSTPGGQRYPDADQAIDRRVQSGALLVNYIGHGGELGWAHERILNISTIRAWSNRFRMPLFMTATCEFSRFDDPERTSAGEYVFLNPTGGGVALLTTTRLVYSWPNEVLNRKFVETLLQQPEYQGQSLGEILMYTKNNTATAIGGDNFRNFALLGDPSMRLTLPVYKVMTDSVNGVAVSVQRDTISALGKVRISGHVADPQTGQILNNFNGIVYPTVYDKISELSTLGQDATSFPKAFNMWKNVIYSGKATVTNGRFSFEFLVPKDIRLDFGQGRVRYYVHDQEKDGNGHSSEFIIGGIDTTAAADNEGPQMLVYLNSTNFVSGGTVGSNPVLMAELFDESGINTVGTGIGHDITVVLDENTANTRILNSFYQADLDTYKSGKIRYELGNLDPGSHTLRFKAWDVFNNSAEEFIEFVVMDADEFKLEHVYNYPNPFTTSTEFMFEHNQSCNVLDVKIQVFTVAGSLVKTINQQVDSRGFRVNGIMWDGLDDYGDRIARGTYIYRLEVRDELGQKAEKIEKLVILR